MNALVQSFQGMNSMRMAMIGLIGAGLVLAFIFLAMRMTSPVLSPLYSNLSPDDSAVIATELGAMGVEFQVASSGSQILVKSPDVLRVRMALAQKGLPSKGSIVGYEIFDKDAALGTSNFVLNINLLRALEGELGRTIGSMNSIKSARVHLVIPKRELFRKEQIDPSASVALTLNNRTDVPKDEIAAIKHLVSSAVPGMKPSRVTIVDSTGRLLARGMSEDESSVAGVSPASTEEFKVNMENRLRSTLTTMLEQAVGLDNVNVQVAAEIGFDRVTTSIEEFDPDGAVARSTQTTSETAASGGTGGEVSVTNNLPEGQATTSGASGDSSERTDETINYEISKTITSKISEVGTVQKLSVAVLVDGRYQTATAEDGTETRTYVARSDEELEQLATLVRTAIGYDEKRGDTVQVINMQFDDMVDQFRVEEGAFDWLKRDLQGILKTVMVGVVAILAIMLVIRPLVNRAFEISPADLEAEAVRSAPEGGGMVYAAAGGAAESEEINLDIIQNKLDSTPTRRVNDLMENNPEETLSVIRSWLSEK